jgi:protein-tyrosine phosphatase
MTLDRTCCALYYDHECTRHNHLPLGNIRCMLVFMNTAWRPSAAYNWRDLGGLPTVDGRFTRAGRLFRSDTLQEVDEADARRLAEEVGLRTVVDLRLAAEVETEGRGGLEGEESVRHLSVPLISVDFSVPGTAVPLLTADLHIPHYVGFLEVSADKFRVIAETLAADGIPAVVHCAAGKDRTGVVVAVLLDAVGVERTAIIDDYVRTREFYPQVHARLERLESYAETSTSSPPKSWTHGRRPSADFWMGWWGSSAQGRISFVPSASVTTSSPDCVPHSSTNSTGGASYIEMPPSTGSTTPVT